MKRRSFRSIVVTGASGGLGRALVDCYAATDVAFLLFGRDAVRLDAVAEQAQAAGATVTRVVCEARDRKTISQAIRTFDAAHPVDLVLHLAGTKCGNQGGVEPDDAFDDVLEANLAFPAYVDRQVIEKMRKRGSGRIALVSSLAAIAPHPDLISYSSSKAGLAAYGTALRRALHGSGVTVVIVTAGFVDTPMTDIHNGPTPMKMSAALAAKHIRNGIDRGRAHVRFPVTLWLASHLLSLLPAGLGDRLTLALRADILNESARSHAANSAASTSTSRSS